MGTPRAQSPICLLWAGLITSTLASTEWPSTDPLLSPVSVPDGTTCHRSAAGAPAYGVTTVGFLSSPKLCLSLKHRPSIIPYVHTHTVPASASWKRTTTTILWINQPLVSLWLSAMRATVSRRFFRSLTAFSNTKNATRTMFLSPHVFFVIPPPFSCLFLNSRWKLLLFQSSSLHGCDRFADIVWLRFF